MLNMAPVFAAVPASVASLRAGSSAFAGGRSLSLRMAAPRPAALRASVSTPLVLSKQPPSSPRLYASRLWL